MLPLHAIFWCSFPFVWTGVFTAMLCYCSDHSHAPKEES